MRRSIRIRLIVWVFAFLLPASLVAAWLLIQLFGYRLLHDIDVALEEEAETVAETLTTPASPEAITDLLSRITAETNLGPRKYITVTRQGQLIAEAPTGAQAMLRSGDHALRVARYELAGPGSSTTVSIAVSAEAAVEATQRLRTLVVVGTPALLLVVLTGLWLIIGRALRPLEYAARELDQIGADVLAIRVPVANTEDEVGRMVVVLNRMLDRLQSAVVQLQRFTADAAHELRTPLTVLRSGLEVALSRERSAPEYHAALSEAVGTTNRLCRLAEDLLTLARLDAAGVARTAASVDLGEVLRELAEGLEERTVQGHLSVETALPRTLWVHGNAGDLYRLFNNLLDNATRHGGNGAVEGNQITLSAQRADRYVQVTIADNGPGIAPQEMDRVFDRFYRGSENRRESPGSGLGLSIAREIARIHGGTLTLSNGTAGGCVATVRLPAAPDVVDSPPTV